VGFGVQQKRVGMESGKMIVKTEKGETAKNIHLRLANLQNMCTNLALQDMNGNYWFTNYVWRENGYAVNPEPARNA
jgi:hypothetical protein